MAALEAIKSKLSPLEIAEIQRETAELKAVQAAHDDPADLAKLPALSTADLERKSTAIPIEVRRYIYLS